MANTSITLKKLTAAVALSVCSFAQAGVLNFEQPPGPDLPFAPFVTAGDQFKMGEFWVQSFGGSFVGDLVGQIMDGSAPEDCALACPVNNGSHYYAGLADGYFYFGLNNDYNFRVKSLKASFMGIPEASTGLLVLQGFNAADQAIGTSVQLGLGGPNALGQYNFATYNLGAFSNTEYSYVRVLGYGCVGSSCTRVSNLSNFAIDDIETIPEPTTWALIGLGLLGVGVFTRRRAA